MLKFYFSLLFIVSSITAQTTYIPDDNFEQALIDLGYDDILDDYIITSNISGIKSLEVYSKAISNLTGIEGFVSLTYLNCSDNYLTTLDVSKNLNLGTLHCSHNQLTSLDFSKNANLELLSCHVNQLSSIDLSQSPNLLNLNCGGNQLTSLDVSQNTHLQILICYQNQLTSLDVDRNKELQSLVCGLNKLTILDVSQNTDLTTLYCYDNQITNLDLKNAVDLSGLWCENNQLTSLDMSQNENLEELQCFSNQLTSINVYGANNLQYFSCNNNHLTSLDVSQNTALTTLYCHDNQLTSLNVKNGNNSLFSGENKFKATNNPSLKCIQVDNEIEANAGLGVYGDWAIDVVASYSEDCQAFLDVDDEILANSITIFPNPFSDILNIESNRPIIKVELYSILGQRVIDVNTNINSIYLGGLLRGIYMIRIYGLKGTTVRKLIKI